MYLIVFRPYYFELFKNIGILGSCSKEAFKMRTFFSFYLDFLTPYSALCYVWSKLALWLYIRSQQYENITVGIIN